MESDPTEETDCLFLVDNAEYKKFFGKAQKDLKVLGQLVSDAETTLF
jgi:hypothetical protein